MKIEQEDIFTLDLSKANVVTLYLLPTLNVKLDASPEKSTAVPLTFTGDGVGRPRMTAFPAPDVGAPVYGTISGPSPADESDGGAAGPDFEQPLPTAANTRTNTS